MGETMDRRSLPRGDPRITKRNWGHDRPEGDAGGISRQPGERGPQLEGVEMRAFRFREMIRSVKPSVARILRDPRQALPARPVDPELSFDHQCDVDHDEVGDGVIG